MPERDKEITDPLISIFGTVPSMGAGVCPICRSQPGPGFDICYGCHLTTGQVTYPLPYVVPISLYQTGGQLWHVLRHYKDSPSVETRSKFTHQIAATLSRFMRLHSAHLGQWDTITTVPPTRSRSGGIYPLEQAINRVLRFREPYIRTLRAGPNPPTHQNARDDGYEVIADIRGKELLLMDDTFTSGASIQSAASALTIAGARSVKGLVVGRVINPEYSPDIWRTSQQTPFSFDVCCLEGSNDQQSRP